MGGEAGFGAGGGVVMGRLAQFAMKELPESDPFAIGISGIAKESERRAHRSVPALGLAGRKRGILASLPCNHLSELGCNKEILKPFDRHPYSGN